jgi:uncharacterized protein HemX
LIRRVDSLADEGRVRNTFADQRDIQRDKIYEQRTQAVETQLRDLDQQVDRLLDVANKLYRVDADVTSLIGELKRIDSRLQDVEHCRSKVEEHLRATAADHDAISTARARMRTVGWLGGGLVFLGTSLSGLMPLLERIWPKQ